jgi:hypothetical protein
MFSLAQEELLKETSVPSLAIFSRIKRNESENAEKFRSYVAAAAEFGPKLKKTSSLVTALDTQINHYRKELKQIRRKVRRASVPPSESLLQMVADIPSGPSKTPQQSLTPKQLDEIRDRYIYNFNHICPKHLYRPVPARNGPSLQKDVDSKARKSQRLSIKKTGLKQEIVTLARELEKITVTKASPKVKLSAVPCHVSDAVSSEYHKKLSAVKARVR